MPLAKNALPAPLPDDFALLLSSTMILMNTFALRCLEGGACKRLAMMIERHLELLAQHAAITDVLRQTVESMTDRWEALCNLPDKPAAKKQRGVLVPFWPRGAHRAG
jgi:hypothetical protein